MKMKMKIRRSIIIILAAITFNNCSNFLKEELPNRVVFDEFFQANYEAVSFLYSGIQSLQSVFFGTNYLAVFELPSDQMYYTARDNSLREFCVLDPQNSSTHNANVWRYLYETIARMNMLIDHVKDTPIGDYPETPRIVAQARFVRAFSYFNAVRLWGPVPITRAYYNTSGNIEPGRSPVAEVYDFIIEDLLFGLDEENNYLRDFSIAADGKKIMPDVVRFQYRNEKGETSGQPFYLPISKGAAQLLLAKVYMTRKKSGDYELAETLVDALIGNPLYNLLPNYEDLFQTDKKTTPNRAREVLFEIEASAVSGIFNSSHREVAPNTSTRIKPATVNGVATIHNELVLSGPTNATGYGRWVPTEHFLKSFDPLKDKRYWWMYQFTGGIDLLEKPTQAPNFRKGHDHTGSQQDGAANSLLLRFADALLIKAELRARANDPAGVQAAIDPVLLRAGLDSYNTAGKTQQQMINDVLDERAREFAHEAGNRLFDMRRVGFKDELERGFIAYHKWLDELRQEIGATTFGLVFINPKANGKPVVIMMDNPAYVAKWDPENPAYNPAQPGDADYNTFLAYNPNTPAKIENPKQDQSVGGDRFIITVPFLNNPQAQVPYLKRYSITAEFHPIPLQEVLRNKNMDNSMNLPNYN